ncbi:MAG TPA: N-6 DNA methylase [Patescibacteria group bacterium]|nr:N-6 DNA methylase [Patescibacteria group bacterium]
MRRNKQAAFLAFDALTVEGSLIAPAMLAKIAIREAGGQTEADYGIPKGLNLRDEVARYFRIAQALFQELNASSTPSTAATVKFTEALLRDVFGFADISRVGSRTLDGRQYPVTLEALDGRVPVVVVPPSDGLDRASNHLPSDGRRRSSASAIQDWLNACDETLWGFCCNGEYLRLVRDNDSLTRPAYIEANLRQMFDAEAFADFTALWLLVHASRFGTTGLPLTDCPLERWRESGSHEGAAARERLREGVEAALLVLGSGFLSGNSELRRRVQESELPLTEFFGQLLRLVYRLIFLLVAEDRGLLHPPEAPPSARRLYAEGYSLSSLRDRAIRRSARDDHHDRWEGLLVVFTALARGEKRLGLTALGGLFANDVMPDLEGTRLSNRALMEAIFRLGWLRDDATLMPVNWRDMETEELGSVYESLLELTPRLAEDGRAMAFAVGGETKGNTRKTTGSYYTPDALVQCLLDSALDPVLDRVEAEAEDTAAGLLSVTVLDPACGSGHFLLAAARRIATRVARARAGGVASADDFRHALRDVARSCIHGVDRNPMAVELTKVALWIETMEPGKPLGFLDASIRCGDSLLGVFDLEVLHKGIPDAAYKPLTGDDKETAKHFAKRNKAEREGQGTLDFAGTGGRLPPAPPIAGTARALRALPEDTPEEIAEKRRRFTAARSDPRSWTWKVACDLYVAAFLTPKIGGVPANANTVAIPTTGHVWQVIAGRQIHAPLQASALDLAAAASAFHWPLEFPDVMAGGGFDVVLGNPPWERIKLQEQEFFAALEPAIAEAPTAAARGRMIAALGHSAQGSRQRVLYQAFETAKRIAEASSVFARVPGRDRITPSAQGKTTAITDEGGRFPLAGRGDVNTYALFAELFAGLIGVRGRAGVIVPTGIATDATTAPFFAALVDSKRLASLFDFENRQRIFPAIDSRIKFCLLTIGRDVLDAKFAFFLTDVSQLSDPERRFSLSPDDIARINPNAKTAPTFRSKTDAELTAKIYARVPVFIDEGNKGGGNPWGATFHTRIWHMAEDSEWFRTAVQLAESGYMRDGADWIAPEGTAPAQRSLVLTGGRDVQHLDLSGGSENAPLRYVPLYEAKMIHQLDHRWATYDGISSRDATVDEKVNPEFEPTPRYWVPENEVISRLDAQGWSRKWLTCWRDITNATNERTVIATALPRTAVGHKAPLIFIWSNADDSALVAANLSSIVVDYCARQKVGGTSLTITILKQLPILTRLSYTKTDRAFISAHVLELIYTSNSMAAFAKDLGYEGPPFTWGEERRANLRAELDAWYARAYGLTRDELRYILDPADVKGEDYPSETFRGLKNNEIRQFGEYRTARLVLEAWDRMERTELHQPELPIVTAASQTDVTSRRMPLDPATLPDGAWARSDDTITAATAQAQLAALIKALPGPTPAATVRLSALFALEPRYLTRRLVGADHAAWCRLVGSAADTAAGGNVVALAPRMNAVWRDAVAQLIGMGAIIVDSAAQTWAAGPRIGDCFTESWPDGRAGFVLKALESLSLDDTALDLAVDDASWVRNHAAA